VSKLIVTKGATSNSVAVFIRDSSSSTGAGLTGLAYNTASLVASYVRPGAARTAITLATQTVTGAYSSGGFVEVDATNMPGVYRLDVPNAVFATGVNSAVVMLKGATNMESCVMEFGLQAVDLQDAVRGGLTALPNAAAAAAGGLFTRGTGAGQINQDANGRIDVNIVNAAVNTINASALATDAVTEIQSGLATSSALTTAQTSLTDIQGRIPAALVGGRMSSDAVAISGSTVCADNLQTAFDDTAGAVPWTGIIDQGTAQSATSTTLVLRAAAAFANSEPIGSVITITGGTTGVGQSRQITAYNGATDTATVDAWTTTPTGTITYKIVASPPAPVTLPQVNTTQFAGQTITAAAGVTLPSTVASPTNITAGTITTVTNLTNAPTAGDFTAAMKASINVEALDVLNTDTYAEPGQGAPAATTTLATKIGYIYKFLRNKVTQDATTFKVYADDTTTVDQKATVSDDGTTFTRGEIATGP